MEQMKEILGDDLPLDPFTQKAYLFSLSPEGIPVFQTLGQDQAPGGTDPLDRDLVWVASEQFEGRPEVMEELRTIIRAWDNDVIDADALLKSLRAAQPDASEGEIGGALESVARGDFSAASSCAAAALCQHRGLGDPVERASELYNDDAELTDSQWVIWVASNSFGWILNSGLSACYYEFEARQYEDRIRGFEQIGATAAAEVMRRADAAFGDGGPPPVAEDRSQYHSDEAGDRFEELAPEFWALSDEVSTRAYLYALEHPDDFTPPGP